MSLASGEKVNLEPMRAYYKINENDGPTQVGWKDLVKTQAKLYEKEDALQNSQK